MKILIIVLFYLVILFFDYIPSKNKNNKKEKIFYLTVFILTFFINIIIATRPTSPSISSDIMKLIRKIT